MIGIGENKKQILKTMKDLKNADVDFLTIGQYLQPSKKHAEINKYYTP
jgi:lipoyl synthase